MLHLKREIFQRLRGAFSPIIVKGFDRKFDLRNTIVVSGYFRSGTTWFAEQIAKAAGAGIVFEPFHIDHVDRARSVGFSYDNFRAADDDWPEGEKFVCDVLTGRALNQWTAAHLPLATAAKMRRLLVKLVSSNQLLPWLTATFDVPKPALIIRHPCAVLASWLNRGWRLNSWVKVDERLMAYHPEVAELVKSLRHDEEFFAARWCIDHYVPLASSQLDTIAVVPYEKLVLEGPVYLEKVLDIWGLALNSDSDESMRQPSAKASELVRSDYFSILSNWRDSLSHTQIQRVLRVVREFGLDFYVDEIEPDYMRLQGGSPLRR